MKTYVYSHISFFNNQMTSKIIESDKTMLEVAMDEFYDLDYNPEGINDLDSLKDFAFDCDSMFEIIEVPGPVG